MSGGAGESHGKGTDRAGQFAPFEARMRDAGLADIVIDNFRYYYGALLSGDTGLIPEADISPVESVPDIADLSGFAAAGERHIGRAVILKLNGGLGTSMGLQQAKSLLPVRDGLTFLDIVARQVLAARRTYDRSIPLILMNSFNTDDDTRSLLEQYDDLESMIPLTLMQNKVPKVLREGYAPASGAADPDLEWCPPGHGEVYIALKTSGMLATLLENGYDYLFMSNVDNLAATLDPAILGYMVERSIPFLMEVADRTSADRKGGHLARRNDGQLILREVAQCPEGDMAAFQDIGRHRYFNTNNIWVNLRALDEQLERHGNVLKLPMIRNSKTLDPTDSRSPGVYQLETAMGAAIAVFPGAQALRVTRQRFLPVKLCSDLLALRSDVYLLNEDYTLSRNPRRTRGPLTIELDDRYYKLIEDFEDRFPQGAPSLVDCTRLRVEGDVLFERDVVCVGEVAVSNETGAQRRVSAGARLADEQVDLGVEQAA